MEPFTGSDGEDRSTVMMIADGGSCAIKLSAGENGSFKGFTIVRAPHDGKLVIPNARQVAYVVNKGFIGNDHFTVRSVREGPHGAEPTSIAVTVFSR
jgi:hypothetical protein